MEYKYTCEVVLQAQLGETFSNNLTNTTFHLDLCVEVGKLLRIVTQTPDFLLEFNREGDDVRRRTAVICDPFHNAGEIFVLLAEIVFHA